MLKIKYTFSCCT